MYTTVDYIRTFLPCIVAANFLLTSTYVHVRISLCSFELSIESLCASLWLLLSVLKLKKLQFSPNSFECTSSWLGNPTESPMMAEILAGSGNAQICTSTHLTTVFTR